MRDYHGRGLRGPVIAGGVRARGYRYTRAGRFDYLSLGLTERLATPWAQQLGEIELVIEDVPHLPLHWSAPVPLTTWIFGHHRGPSQLVLFRRPLLQRVSPHTSLAYLLATAITEQLATALGISVTEFDQGPPHHP